MAIDNAHNVSYDIRQDLFTRTANLSGAQFDAFGLPSLISRMTSDSYNVQSCVQTLQTLWRARTDDASGRHLCNADDGRGALGHPVCGWSPF